MTPIIQRWITRSVTFRLPKDIHYKIGVIAGREDTSVSSCIRQFLITAVCEWEHKYGDIELPDDINFKKERAEE